MESSAEFTGEGHWVITAGMKPVGGSCHVSGTVPSMLIISTNLHHCPLRQWGGILMKAMVDRDFACIDSFKAHKAPVKEMFSRVPFYK